MRGNNPGNLRRWGQMPVVNGFAVFPNLPAGMKAMAEQLQLYGKRQINTIQKIVMTWAPSSDGNNTSKYIQNVVQSSGYPEHQVLDLTDPTMLGRLMYGMIRQEQGAYPDAALLRSIVGLPEGAPLTGKFATTPTVAPTPAKTPPAPTLASKADAPATPKENKPDVPVVAKDVVVNQPAAPKETVDEVVHDLEELSPADQLLAEKEAALKKPTT